MAIAKHGRNSGVKKHDDETDAVHASERRDLDPMYIIPL
jgi:hypothetical protein